MHLINKKTDSNITDALLLYTVVTKPTYWVNCHLCVHVLPKIQLSTRTGNVKQFPKPFLILPFFFFCYYKSASDTNQNNTETMTTCKINFPEEK